MASLEVCCGFCRRRMILLSGRKGRAGEREIEASLYAEGWTGTVAHGRWACSDDCRSYLARDVTPTTR